MTTAMREKTVLRACCAVLLAAGWLAACGGGNGTGGAAGTSGGSAGTTGSAGSSGSTGAAGTTGTGGATGAAGALGLAGTMDQGTAGSGGSGASGGATGTAGSGGSAGSAGATGAGGTAGTTGSGGATGGRGGAAGGTGGSAGGAGGRGGSGGTAGGAGRGGAGGTAGASGAAGMLASNSLAVRFANSVMSRWANPDQIAGQLAGWEYNHGIVLRGIEGVWRHTNDARYLTYIQRYVDGYVGSNGSVPIPAANMHSFDNMQPSIFLPLLYQQTGMAKYKTAADSVHAYYASIPTNPDGGYWHKQQYPNQMWLDSIYMGQPFLMRYATAIGTCGSSCSDAVFKQTLLIAQHVRDTNSGLLYHAWDDSPAGMKATWANATTGRSPSVWGRALGWYAMSLVDLLPDLPAGTQRDQLLAILQGLAMGLKNTQDASTGLWFQVVDQGGMSNDWLESSGSGMFVYALKVGVNRGYLDASYLTVANRGWTGMMSKVTNSGGNSPSITGAVKGMGVQDNYAAYVATTLMPLLTDSPHGLCAILLAASEMEAQ
jgi:unsaturated rhamnogalacturonyl hydrolase